MGPRIVIVGSVNMDLIVKLRKLPVVGETVIGGTFKMSPGGKGANQAVAAAKLGAESYFVGRIGADDFGKALMENFKRTGVNSEYVTVDRDAHSGVALIMVDQAGKNLIAVASGANSKCSVEDVDRAKDLIEKASVLLLQLEIPVEVVQHAALLAKQGRSKVILNPAPARPLPKKLFELIDVIVPNEVEAEVLTGIPVKDLSSAREAGEKLLGFGTEAVVITLGERGALLVEKEGCDLVPGVSVEAVDTTGAGDAFCGALAFALATGKSLKEAVFIANCAGALATTKIGAQEALPTLKELESFLKEKKHTLQE
ncbi:MAG: ribokinase [Thermoproteota archaeon]|nr:MAG: ribokinase [Candidatus Korarchaeota archaeon]